LNVINLFFSSAYLSIWLIQFVHITAPPFLVNSNCVTEIRLPSFLNYFNITELDNVQFILNIYIPSSDSE